jgi:hypothetical protein
MDAGEGINAELQTRMTECVKTATGNLEDMRMLARDAAKYIERSGVPGPFHAEAIQLVLLIETLEARLSEYAVEVTS